MPRIVQRQPVMQSYLDGIPFLCVAGVREYHDHRAHSGDLWELHRAAGAGPLVPILEVIDAYGLRPLTGYNVNLTPQTVGFVQGRRPGEFEPTEPLRGTRWLGERYRKASASSRREALIGTLMQLGRDLGLRNLAERVETTREMDRLREQLDEAQGFLLADPSTLRPSERKSLHPLGHQTK
jgi:hypothetical protein